jgi:hypothetical protein
MFYIVLLQMNVLAYLKQIDMNSLAWVGNRKVLHPTINSSIYAANINGSGVHCYDELAIYL